MSNASDYAKHQVDQYKQTGSYHKETLSEWLYGDWDEAKYKRFLQMSSVPYLREYMDYLLALRRDQEYLAANGMSYEDIHDPTKLPSYGAGRSYYSSVLNFVSSNVKRLYN